MAQRVSVPLPIGGMFSGGDPALIPQGKTLVMQNMVPKAAGKWAKRDPWIYDNKASASGKLLAPFALWDDLAAGSTRMLTLAGDGAANPVVASLKAASGDTWTALAGVTQDSTQYLGTIGDYANLRGVLYANGAIGPATSQGTTTHFSFNGAAITPTSTTDWTVPTPLQSFTLCSFIDRLFFGYAQATVNNILAASSYAYAYDPSLWALTGVTSSSATMSGKTLYTLNPTSTTAASAIITASGYSVPAQAIPRSAVYRCDLQGVDPAYRAPMTLDILLNAASGRSIAVAVGEVIIPSTRNGYRYKCTTAGTTAAAEPVWGTTIGGTTADNTATWTCDGPDSFGRLELTLPNATDTSDFTSYWCDATIPPHANAIGLAVRIQWGNTATATGWTLSAVNVGLKDGLGASDPRKANKGQQLTYFDPFRYPFFNREAGSTATLDIADILWSETTRPGTIQAKNTYQLVDAPGRVTCVRPLGNRLLAFKRRGLWWFQGTADPDNPIAREGFLASIGCLHHRAFDTMDGVAYFIGEDEVYAYAPGGDPVPLCGEAMREEIMAKGSTWVESQSAHYNTPILTIDRANRILYVYTQSAKIYGMYLNTRDWFVIDVLGNATIEGQTFAVALPVSSLVYNPTTQGMYVLTVSTLSSNQEVRKLTASSAKDTDAAAATTDITALVSFAPLEGASPRYEAVLDYARLFHTSTATQSGQTTYAEISLDQGKTFPKFVTMTLAPVSTRGEAVPLQLPVGPQLGETLTLRVQHVGKGGAANFSLTRAEATLRVMRGEWPKSLPTIAGATLTP